MYKRLGNHSPAPWRISGQSESGRYITVKAANGRTVARVPFNGENTPLGECTDAADATAIALAPEALAALAAALEALKYVGIPQSREAAIKNAEAVLAKWAEAQ